MSLKLGHKILLLVCVPLVFSLVVISLFAIVHRQAASAEIAADHSDTVLGQTRMLWDAMVDANDNGREYVLTRDTTNFERFRQSESQLPQLVLRLEQLVRDNPVQEEKITALCSASTLQLEVLARSVDAVNASPRLTPEERANLLRGSNGIDVLRSQMKVFTDDELHLQAERDAALARQFNVFNDLLVICAIAAFALTLLIMLIFSRMLVRRLAELGDALRTFTASGTMKPTAIHGNDEISQLHRSFYEMADTLAEKQKVLARYQLMVKNARDVVLFLDCDDLRIVDANDAAVASYGYDRAELLSKTIRDLRTPYLHAVHDYELKRNDGAHTLFESRHRRKDGSTFPVEVAGSSAEIDGKRVLLTVVRDVSERKRAENEREQFFNRSNDLMGVIDFGGRLKRINTAWETALGYSLSDMGNSSLLDFVHMDDRDRSASVLMTLARGEPISSFENRCVRKDGSYVWLSWSATPSVDEGLIYAVARDVSKRKEIESELALSRDQAMEASLLKSQFLANMSHEIRTPMNGIVATSELLLRAKLGGTEREYAGIIGESARALLKIINQILDLSKLEASKLDLESAEFEPVNVAESVTELIKAQAAQKGLSLHTFVAEQVPRTVLGDAGRLRQILLNLLGNALKFTDRGAVTLRVSLQAEDVLQATLRFAVADTGIGLSPEARERLFVPFTQVDGSNSRKYDGTGLGLSISKRLVELMHGDIGVTSESGVGSTFWFTARFTKAGSATLHASDPPLRGRRLLIVEADSTDRDILAQYARSWGVRSTAMSDTRGVIQLLREAVDAGDPYQFLIVDLSTADVEAWRLSESIASDPTLSSTRLILATTLDARESLQESANVAGFLSKPVRQSQLHDCLITATHVVRADSLAPETISGGDAGLLSAGRTRILLAEDHAINRRIALAQLNELGIQADVARNGQEAIDAYERRRYEIILMDCQMPEVDGFAATRAIRAIQARDGGDVRIIAMTANAMEGDREACIKAGMDDYLPKPVELDRLRKVLLPTPVETSTLKNHPGAEVVPITGTAPILDLGRLRQIFHNDAQAVGEALDLSTDECRRLAAATQTAVARRETLAATQAAHALKGICGNVGAGELASIGLYIERAAKSADWTSAQAGCDELDAALNRFVAAATAIRSGTAEMPMLEAI